MRVKLPHNLRGAIASHGFGVPISEAHIERTCTDYLALDGWVALVTDPKQLRGLGVSEPGIPDRQYRRESLACGCGMSSTSTPNELVCACAQLLWIEWKRVNARGKATKTSAKQDAWHEAERARGFLTLRAGVDFPATIDGFIEWYEKSGLMRRKH